MAEREGGISEDTAFDAPRTAIVAKIFNRYREVVHFMLAKLGKAYPRKTEIYGREKLVAWITYCLCFAQIKATYGEDLPGMGVCLRYQDLEHTVISSRRLMRVLHIVKIFLMDRYEEGKELFSLRCHDTTFSMGEVFARKHMKAFREAEARDAKTRETNYWAKVQSKKRSLSSLRAELANLESDQRKYQINVDRAQKDYNRSLYNRSLEDDLNYYQSELNKVNSSISSKKSEIEQMNVAPESVMQPLPEDDGRAFRWLFFLKMPDSLRLLATLSFTAQQMLMPKSGLFKSQDNGKNFPRVRIKSDSIVKYHQDQKRVATYCVPNFGGSADGQVRLHTHIPFSSVIPQFQQKVDNIHGYRDGVWYPDACRPRMSWDGGVHTWDKFDGEFDPFSSSREASILFCTEQVQDSSLQWALKQDGSTDKTRGNIPLSTQSSKPNYLSITEYLCFCRLRAYPMRQMRDVIACIGDRSLPLHQKDVQKLILQVMFHVGSLSDSNVESQSFRWKRDLYDQSNCGLVHTADAILNSVGQDLQETPSNAESTYVIGAICNFLSGWTGSLKAISRGLGVALSTWANDIETRVQDAKGEEDISDLKLKQSLLLRRAILCFAGGPLNDLDIENVVVNTVESKNLCLSDEDQSGCIASECVGLVASRLQEILKCVNRRPDILTRALRKVVVGAPDQLEWKLFVDPTSKVTRSACYEAKNKDCLYTVNLLTGILLVDGLPPVSLPKEILDHPLYKRVFGTKNFEVVTKNGILETTKLTAGCTYQFLRTKQKLHVTEIESSTKEEHMLLDWTTIDQWGAELQPRLVQMHSHWINMQNQVIALRGQPFHDKHISFLLTFCLDSSSVRSEVEVSPLVIPDHRRSMPLLKLIDQTSTFRFSRILVPFDLSQVGLWKNVLEKFEHPDFIHIMRESSGLIRLELPRFRLTFDFQNGCFVCKELRGFTLCEGQILSGTMNGFIRYIVLKKPSQLSQATDVMELRDNEVLVIIPDGIVRQEDGIVRVDDRDSSCSAICNWFQYALHPRYRTLQAWTTTARIHLACIHLASSMILPDSMFGLTGSERALQLIRECWTTKPYSPPERIALDNLIDLSRGTCPNIFLLCLDNLKCSEQVAFLYEDTDSADYEPRYTPETGSSDDLLAHKCDDSVRMALLPQEMLRLSLDDERKPVIQGLGPFYQLDDDGLSISTTTKVDTLEQSLFSLLKPRVIGNIKKEFPLDHMKSNCNSGVEKDVFEDTFASWNNFVTGLRENTSVFNWFESVMTTKKEVEKETKAIWDYVHRSLHDAAPGELQNRLSFHRLTNILPAIITPMDLIKGVYDPTWLSCINPTLSVQSQMLVRDAILEWLRLVVLGDKIRRLEKFRSENKFEDIKKELGCTRLWRPANHPSWVAFEVDQGIQIRPEQAVVAQHLLNNPRHVVQLNMGMGKTSKLQ